jgi:hypothetical protein
VRVVVGCGCVVVVVFVGTIKCDVLATVSEYACACICIVPTKLLAFLSVYLCAF